MRGICFEQVEIVATRQMNDPVIEHGNDAIVTVQLSGLCGSDLHPFFGRETGMDAGTVMGHEFVGQVVETGDEVRTVRKGDRVCAPFTTSCGECFYCKQGLTARCVQGQLFGWRSGGVGLHGAQAELVRVPLADGTLVKLDEDMPDEVALLVGDNLSTGYFCAEMAGIHQDGVYVVVGCGTVGLLCLLSCCQLGASKVLAYDLNASRLTLARKFGAETFTSENELKDRVMSMTDGRGADGVMELVGLPDAGRLAFELIRPGGTMSVIGCHCTPNFAFGPTDAYDKNLTYRTGRCPARSLMPKVTELFRDQYTELGKLITHRFGVEQSEQAYDIFANRKDGCIKAVIEF